MGFCELRILFYGLLVTTFLRNPEWRKRKIVIVSPDACTLGKRMRRYWGVDVNRSIIEIPLRLEDAVERLVAAAQ